LAVRAGDGGCRLVSIVTAVVGELPILKMCDRGLFDVAKREHLSTIVE
jgi:adenine deaminase